MKRLPALSLTVVEALTLMDKPEADMPALADCLSRDTGLASRLLHIANSPFYGLSRRIGSIRDACVYLGLHTIRNIVTAVGVIEQFSGAADHGFDHMAFWQHCAGVAATSRVLALRIGSDPELAFTTGLLHDVGRMALVVFYPDAWEAVTAHARAQDVWVGQAEKAVLGVDHTRIGQVLSARWRLPEPIVLGIAKHHSPDAAAEVEVAGIVHIADILIRGLEFGCGGDDAVPRLSETTLERLRLGWDDLPTIMTEVEPMLAPALALIEQSMGQKAKRR
jgi:putative nucleotidyltransferase with HDIG domain